MNRSNARKLSQYLIPLFVGICAIRNICCEELQNVEFNSVPVLLNKISQASFNQKEKIANNLKNVSPATEGDVILLLKESKKNKGTIRKAMMHALDNVDVRQMHLKSVYKSFLDDKDQEVQMVGMHVLGKMDAKEAAPKILSLMRRTPKRFLEKFIFMDEINTSTPYLYLAAESLVKLDYLEAADEILSRDEIMIRESYGGSLVARYGAKVMPKLLQFYSKGGRNRDAALAVITQMEDPNAIPILLTLLNGSDELLKKASISSISQMPKIPENYFGDITKAIEPFASNKSSFFRARAYSALLRIDNKKYLPWATMALKNDMDVRLEILYALMRNPTPDAVPYLEEFIQYDETQWPNSTFFRQTAAQVIFKTSGKKIHYKGLENDQKQFKDPYTGK